MAHQKGSNNKDGPSQYIDRDRSVGIFLTIKNILNHKNRFKDFKTRPP